MSKGIVIIDIPEKCDDCPMCTGSYDGNHVWMRKCLLNERMDIDIYSAPADFKKPLFCPIHPMPEKKNGYFDIIVAPYGSGIQKGWNDCVDFLEGSKK